MVPTDQTKRRAQTGKGAETARKQGERIAKVIARSGLCSRRTAEVWIEAGRVAVNGKTLDTPAHLVTSSDRIDVDGAPLPQAERTRLWLFHKPKGLLTAARDPEGRPVLPDALPDELKTLHPVGRLDFNTEGLLLLTNDGGLKRVLELPSTGWLRRYRVRAFGDVDLPALDRARAGMTVDGVRYGPMEIAVERRQGGNQWLTVGLREGKNREVKVVLGALGLQVNRLIRVSYGPFQLGDLASGDVSEVRARILKDQLGAKLAEQAGADFDAGLRAETNNRRGKQSEAGAATQPSKRAKTREPKAKQDASGRSSTPRRPVHARKSSRNDTRKPSKGSLTPPDGPRTRGKRR